MPQEPFDLTRTVIHVLKNYQAIPRWPAFLRPQDQHSSPDSEPRFNVGDSVAQIVMFAPFPSHPQTPPLPAVLTNAAACSRGIFQVERMPIFVQILYLDRREQRWPNRRLEKRHRVIKLLSRKIERLIHYTCLQGMFNYAYSLYLLKQIVTIAKAIGLVLKTVCSLMSYRETELHFVVSCVQFSLWFTLFFRCSLPLHWFFLYSRLLLCKMLDKRREWGFGRVRALIGSLRSYRLERSAYLPA